MLCLMVHLGGFLVTKMYDARYHAAAWMVPILALGLWHTLMYATTMPALFSIGKSHYAAIGNASYCVAVVTAIPLAFHFFGMLGAVIGVAAGDLPAARASQPGDRTCRLPEFFWLFLGWDWLCGYPSAGSTVFAHFIASSTVSLSHF
jgi:hypothetical protein